MKFWSNRSIYLKWFSLSVLITLCCVAVGVFTTHQIREAERIRDLEDRQNRMNEMKGPEFAYFNILKNLSSSGRYTVDEAYDVIRDAHSHHPFIHSYLLNERGEVISSSLNAPNLTDKNTAHKINESRSLVFAPKVKRFRPEMRDRRPPREGLITGIITLGTSIIAGLGLSVLFMSLYFRKKAKEAELVIGRLKSGDLKARFEIKTSDETNPLMLKFNEMASQIESLVENLRTTESTRTKLLQELAHDLRTPVASLKNLQETLYEKGHLLTDEKRKHVQSLAIKEILYFERLVEDLLFLSGVNDPKFTNSFSKVDLSELLNAEGELFDSDKVKVSFRIQEGISIQGEEHLLRRLVKNSLSNAVRFARSEVVISLEATNKEVKIQISDDGPGLSDGELDSFGEKKYSRKIQESNNEYISIGLGSVIMKKITTLHEGRMTIRNSPEIRGCELTFRFPV